MRPQACKRRVRNELEKTILITGDSGSGKSTVLKLINGLIPHFNPGELLGTITIIKDDQAFTPAEEPLSLALHLHGVDADVDEGFAPAVKKGDTVKAGELLATVDLGAVRAAGYVTTIVVAVGNPQALAEVTPAGIKKATAGDIIITATS